MHFGLSETQRELHDVARRFLASLDPGVDAWPRIVAEQGWQAIPIPEASGGFGLGWMEAVVVQEALGRALTPSPFLGTVLVAAAGVELEPLVAGTIGTVLLGSEMRAEPSSGATASWHLSGTALGLNPEATCVLVEASGQLFQVDVPEGVSLLEAVPVLDDSRPLGRLVLESHPARPVACSLSRVKAVAQVLLAAEAVGGAAACLELAVEYLKVRQQFGQPIGKFQALQHMAADMLVALESARSATWYAAWALDAGTDDALLASHTAKALASDAFFHCAGQNIQLHGGIGFTWEHVAHRYFKRASGSRALFGLPRAHRAAVADVLLGPLADATPA